MVILEVGTLFVVAFLSFAYFIVPSKSKELATNLRVWKSDASEQLSLYRFAGGSIVHVKASGFPHTVERNGHHLPSDDEDVIVAETKWWKNGGGDEFELGSGSSGEKIVVNALEGSQFANAEFLMRGRGRRARVRD